MNEIQVFPPDYLADRIRLRWSVTPSSTLYRNTGCEWIFPETVDPRRLPPSLVALAVLLCLHPHWVLLQPCRVRLPFSLTEAEKEFWRRLMQVQWETLEAYRKSGDPTLDLQVDLEGEGPEIDRPVGPIRESSRCATAFSGGKDSLFQAGILSEISDLPLLVAVTSPLPGLFDHEHPKRRTILDEIEHRCRAQRVEVCSDFRACWDNMYPFQVGYSVSVNELTDTFFYLAMLMLTATSLNAPHLFLASENEVQENLVQGGRLIQHPHAMYSGVVLGAVQTLLAPWGFTCCSLSIPLHSGQVQEILWRRYPLLRNLQFSCWQVGKEAAMCNRCPQCLRIALCSAAAGFDPAEMGADLAGLLVAQRDWKPKSFLPQAAEALPKLKVSARLGAQVFGYVRQISLLQFWQLARKQAALLQTGRALVAFLRLKRLAAQHLDPGWTGYSAPWLETVDPLVRLPLRLIIETYYSPETGVPASEGLRRSQSASAWIAEPLAGLAREKHENESMEGLERIEVEGSLLALVLRSRFRGEGIHFFTPPTFSQQLAYMNRAAGYRIRPHVHLPVSRALVGTQEGLWVKSGRVRIDFYDEAKAYVVSRVLEAGDLVLLTGGGHGFEMLTDCEMVEIKQGPYTPEADKAPIEAVAAGEIRVG